MAKAPSRKLKVFQARIGFYDTVVAAPSQAAALRAWGTHQNLFSTGEAYVATDPDITEAASAHPEIPLRRAIGSNEAFSLEPTSLPHFPDAPRKPKAQAKPAGRKQPAADRSRLDKAEAVLRGLEIERKEEEMEFRQQQRELERRQEAAQTAYVSARKQASQVLETERASYRKAGGRN